MIRKRFTLFHLFAGFLLLLLVVNFYPSAAYAQPGEEGNDSSGRLMRFEKALSDSAATDTTLVRRHHDHEEECDTSSSLLGDIIFFIPKEILKACVASYCDLPGPNYGSYPFSFRSFFTVQYEKEPGNYFQLGGSYSYVYKDIPAGQVQADLYLHSLFLGASYQQFREKGERLHLASARIGARKAVGDYVLWQNHFGWRYMKGTSEMSGFLFGMQFKIFTMEHMAYNIGYDFDFFPEYGTAFHELDGGISYFIGRAELKAGYQAKMIYQGPSLHGSYAGVVWNF